MLLSKPYKSIPPRRVSTTQITLISTSKTCMDLHENVEIRSPEKKFATQNLQEKSKAYKCLRKTELRTWKDKRKRKPYFGHNPPTLTTLPTEISHTVSPHNSKTSNADRSFVQKEACKIPPFQDKFTKPYRKNKNEMWTPVQLSAPNPKKKPRRKCGHESN